MDGGDASAQSKVWVGKRGSPAVARLGSGTREWVSCLVVKALKEEGQMLLLADNGDEVTVAAHEVRHVCAMCMACAPHVQRMCTTCICACYMLHGMCTPCGRHMHAMSMFHMYGTLRCGCARASTIRWRSRRRTLGGARCASHATRR